MMRKTPPFIGLLVGSVLAVAASVGAARAQNAPDLFSILANLQRNPAFAGEVLTTQQYYPNPGSPRFLYEVRILRPDDTIIIVYIDPMTGQIVNNPGG